MRVFAEHFIFNGISSDLMGLMLCDWDGSAILEETSGGSTIDLHTAKPIHRDIWYLYNTSYSNQLTFSIHLIKKDFSAISLVEQAAITRWLIRKDGYKDFQFDNKEYGEVIFRATAIKATMLSVGNITRGIKVDFVCDSPYGYSFIESKTFHGNTTNLFINSSEENGYIYPLLSIHVHQSGEIIIYNSFEDRSTIIENCVENEVITINNELKTITTTSTHNLSNDFNYIWFRLVRRDNEIENSIAIFGNATVTMTYQLIRKVGVE